MRYLKYTMAVTIAFAVIISLSGNAFAGNMCSGCKLGKGGMMDKATCETKIKNLKDSAAALQSSNPDLAKGLTDLAAKKTEMLQKMQETEKKYEAKTKLLRDSAAALQKTNPVLAEELWAMSEMKHMRMGMGKDYYDDDPKDTGE
ncbi:MAG: hypothetical protein HQL30_09950 [Candidatus Omnitrophica bacterium]|nr:hypothetical protein [Candidatus Omnitrophota bacterium]